MLEQEKETLIMNILSGMQNSLDLIRNNISSGEIKNLSIEDLTFCEYSLREISLDNQYSDYDVVLSDDLEISLSDLDEEMYYIRGDN